MRFNQHIHFKWFVLKSETCAGTCSHTCTRDGRKFSELVGGSGHGLAAILDDNVMCSDADPYHGQSNILVHEFAHTVHKRALPYSIKNQVQDIRKIRWVKNLILRMLAGQQLFTHQICPKTSDMSFSVIILLTKKKHSIYIGFEVSFYPPHLYTKLLSRRLI